MNHQTKTWNLGVALKTGATLMAGIAICTWLGGNANKVHRASQISLGSNASMAHQIALPNAHRDSLMAAPSIKGEIELDMAQPGKTASEAKSDTKPDLNQGDKQDAATLRSAIFTLSVLKSTTGRAAHVQGVVS